jgi:hypothetical protein
MLQIVPSAVNLGNDVLDMQNGQWRIILMQLAVFALVASPFPHPRSGLQIHYLMPPAGSHPGPGAGGWR